MHLGKNPSKIENLGLKFEIDKVRHKTSDHVDFDPGVDIRHVSEAVTMFRPWRRNLV